MGNSNAIGLVLLSQFFKKLVAGCTACLFYRAAVRRRNLQYIFFPNFTDQTIYCGLLAYKGLISIALGTTQTVVQVGYDQAEWKTGQSCQQVKQGNGIGTAGYTNDQTVVRFAELLCSNDLKQSAGE